MTTDPTSGDNIMGIRKGKGPDQYGGSFAGGQSGGGAYANPHDTDAEGTGRSQGGQSHQGYYGGGQAGKHGAEGEDHHAASHEDSPDAATGAIADHASQKPGTPEHAAFQRSVSRNEERLEPGDRQQGSDGGPVTGKP